MDNQISTSQEHPIPDLASQEYAIPHSQEHPIPDLSSQENVKWHQSSQEHSILLPSTQEHSNPFPSSQEDTIFESASQEHSISEPITPMVNTERRKRCELTIREKVAVIQAAEQTGYSQRQISALFSVSRSQVNRLVKMKEQILREFYEHNSDPDRKRHPRLSSSPGHDMSALDAQVYEWYKANKERGTTVTGPMIQNKAREVAISLGFTSEFKASEGWLWRFKTRHFINRSRSSVTSGSESAEDTSADSYGIPLPTKLPRIEEQESKVPNKPPQDKMDSTPFEPNPMNQFPYHPFHLPNNGKQNTQSMNELYHQTLAMYNLPDSQVATDTIGKSESDAEVPSTSGITDEDLHTTDDTWPCQNIFPDGSHCLQNLSGKEFCPGCGTLALNSSNSLVPPEVYSWPCMQQSPEGDVCVQELMLGHRFCSNCGHKVGTPVCRHCHNPLETITNYCGSCGRRLIGGVTTATTDQRGGRLGGTPKRTSVSETDSAPKGARCSTPKVTSTSPAEMSTRPDLSSTSALPMIRTIKQESIV